MIVQTMTISSLMLSCSYQARLLSLMYDWVQLHERVAVAAEFWPLPVISLLLFKGIILFHLTVWTKLPHNNDNARFAITTLLTWSLKSVMFSLMTVVSTSNSPLAWKAEKQILIIAIFVGNGLNACPVKFDTITQMLVDTLIRGRKTTHEVNV